jgi:predicted PurR-regulated permease PerM
MLDPANSSKEPDSPLSKSDRPKVRRAAFAGFFLFMAFLAGLLAWPHLTAIIFAGILAGTFAPLQRFLVQGRQWRAERAAFVVCLVIVVVIVLPAVYVLVRLADEVASVYHLVQAPETLETLHDHLFGEGRVASAAERAFLFFRPDQIYSAGTVQAILEEAARALSGSALTLLNALVGNLFSFLYQFTVMILVVFGLLAYGEDVKRFLAGLSPLPADDMETILDRFNEMNYVTLVCNFIGGIIQGGLAGISFAIVGVPSPLLWTVVMIVLAFIPLVGISFITVPAVIYLFVVGRTVPAVIVLIWCGGVALITENWFKPIFMGNRVRLNSLLILLSILGGMSAFGMAGIFYGPLIVLLFLTAAEFIRRARTMNDE